MVSSVGRRFEETRVALVTKVELESCDRGEAVDRGGGRRADRDERRAESDRTYRRPLAASVDEQVVLTVASGIGRVVPQFAFGVTSATAGSGRGVRRCATDFYRTDLDDVAVAVLEE